MFNPRWLVAYLWLSVLLLEVCAYFNSKRVYSDVFGPLIWICYGCVITLYIMVMRKSKKNYIEKVSLALSSILFAWFACRIFYIIFSLSGSNI